MSNVNQEDKAEGETDKDQECKGCGAKALRTNQSTFHNRPWPLPVRIVVAHMGTASPEKTRSLPVLGQLLGVPLDQTRPACNVSNSWTVGCDIHVGCALTEKTVAAQP